MVVYDCSVTVRADGTVEAAPVPESARVVAKRRVQNAPVAPSSERS